MSENEQRFHLKFLSRLAAAFVVLTILVWGMLWLVWPVAPVHIHVRWKPTVNEAQRIEFEQRFQLTDRVQTDGTTWEYQLGDSSTANIRAIIQNEHVDDTHHLNQMRFRPEFAQDRSRRILASSVAVGSVGSILLFALVAAYRRISRTASLRASWWSELTASAGPIVRPSYNARATAAALVTGGVTSLAIAWFAGAALWSAAGALVVVYVGGYLVGSLLVARSEGVALAVIRTIAGLLLTTIGFLLSLVLSLPWFIVPAALIATAHIVRGRTAFAWPHEAVRFQWDGFVAGLLAIIILSPIIMSFFFMAPGRFPPVFYNVDIAYSLEKVHSLVVATTFPPPSLSNLGVQRTYHYGTQALAALIARSSGLLPHHSLFLIVLPLLSAGFVAAAFAVARHVSPALPRYVTVPLLLIATPSLSKSFWDRFAPQLWSATTSTGFSIGRMVGDDGLWGILSNEPQNVGGDFLILGSVAGIAAAPAWGWWLPAFLIGSSIIFKTTAGIALVAGFALSEAWRAIASKRFSPSPQLLLVGSVFTATFVLFFLTSFESAFRVEVYPLFYVREIMGPGGTVTGFVLDIIWLFLPVLIALTASIKDPEKRSAPILVMALAPFIVVNTTRLVHVGHGGEGAGDDWVQIPHLVPFLLHAFALSFVSRRWLGLGRLRRVAVLVTMALAITPVAIAAGRYSLRLLNDPESGHEFVDNQSLAAALAVIPVDGSIIVTNDLRYPAQNFARADRQMQIPALFGHQAFSANFSYEPVEDRRALQRLLQQREWSDAIVEAARPYRWTHLIIRKDYGHPAPIPLEHVFENDFYAVYRFP